MTGCLSQDATFRQQGPGAAANLTSSSSCFLLSFVSPFILFTKRWKEEAKSRKAGHKIIIKII